MASETLALLEVLGALGGRLLVAAHDVQLVLQRPLQFGTQASGFKV